MEVTGKIEERNNDLIAEDLARTMSFYAKSFSEVKKLRVTSFQSAEECPRRWFKDTIGENIKPSQNTHSRIGTIVHLLCENIIKRSCWNIEFLTDKQLTSAIAELYKLAPLKELENFNKYAERLSNFAKDWELLEVEQEYEIPVNLPVPVFGQLDAIFRNKHSGNIRIVDHKTNRKPETREQWKAKLQPQLYSLAVMSKYRLNDITFQIGQVNNKEEIIFAYTSKELDGILSRSKRIWDTLVDKQLNPPAKLNNYCIYCAHVSDCKKYATVTGQILPMFGATLKGKTN